MKHLSTHIIRFTLWLTCLIFSSWEFSMQINHIVIPAAGLGTRFLPITKSLPKELIPLVDRPALEYILQEGLDAHINNFYVIANHDKQIIFDHFSPNLRLNTLLEKTNKSNLLSATNTLIDRVTLTRVDQSEPQGLGHAILMARESVGNNPFAVMLPDDIFVSKVSVIAQLIAVAQKYNAVVIGVQKVPQEKLSSYGIITVDTELEPGVFVMRDVVEKPHIQDAPSDLAIAGRYIFTADLFDILAHTAPSKNGEIQLTDAITTLIKQGKTVLAYDIDAIRLDTGNPHEWLMANIVIAAQKADYHHDLVKIQDYLEKNL